MSIQLPGRVSSVACILVGKPIWVAGIEVCPEDRIPHLDICSVLYGRIGIVIARHGENRNAGFLQYPKLISNVLTAKPAGIKNRRVPKKVIRRLFINVPRRDDTFYIPCRITRKNSSNRVRDPRGRQETTCVQVADLNETPRLLLNVKQNRLSLDGQRTKAK